jgi:dsRNA-specific ribonuclease
MRRHTFHNQWLLRLALVHTSAYPHAGSGNLAWLGDSALYLIASEQLAASYSTATLGELTAARAQLISRETCTE